MTTAILIGGLVVTLVIAWLMLRPTWRLPGLLFALLAVPGNVDNLLPQMRLDPHQIANATAPAISFVDLLIAWAIVLTVREGLLAEWPRWSRLIAAVAIAFGLLAAGVSLINLAQGVEPAAVLRGVLTLARIPALVVLVIALRDATADGRRLAIAFAAALVALIGNGVFTAWQLETTRFTAATFGRNGFSLVLVVAALATTGLGIGLWSVAETWRARAVALVAFALAAAGLFGAIATGTRMSLLVAVPAVAIALLVNRTWAHRRGIMGLALIAVGIVAVAGAATLWTAEGGRALSVVTDPGETVDIISDPGGEPDYSPVRTRTHWWNQALSMVRGDPATGVGPYQWNIRRYELDPSAAPIVADPHNTYIQMGAEYGLPVLAVYVAGLTLLALAVLATAWRSTALTRRSPVATAVAAGALMIPLTELTNSHLFNVRIGAVTWLLLALALSLTLLPTLAARTSRVAMTSTRPIEQRRHDRPSHAAREG